MLLEAEFYADWSFAKNFTASNAGLDEEISLNIFTKMVALVDVASSNADIIGNDRNRAAVNKPNEMCTGYIEPDNVVTSN